MKVKQRKGVIRIIFKMPLSIAIPIKSSRRDRFTDIVVNRFMFNPLPLSDAVRKTRKNILEMFLVQS